ncbi:hypothetical protein [Chamaesiphon minutus]|uniref:Uncharacterized protein n=1 Tax=Chamaesiphon minutus (strain ATCC 27169 / PCC 6605) TaxID=1173020 RepID=K9UEE9_CHAP6|nr:hypothetical protein [Chamaesiphon minutus]AFY93497.1 hypothetical protein Cha6605_2439 [Chamaesiphon minutus PCC 6605]
MKASSFIKLTNILDRIQLHFDSLARSLCLDPNQWVGNLRVIWVAPSGESIYPRSVFAGSFLPTRLVGQ